VINAVFVHETQSTVFALEGKPEWNGITSLAQRNPA